MTLNTTSLTAGMTPIKKIGRFVLYRELGRGAVGSVYLGHDPIIDRHVAIKLFHHLSTDQDQQHRNQLFMNEARAAGRLSHPNIITIFDAASESGVSFIAMEYLQGQDLRRFLAQEKSFSYLETAEMLRKIAEGLEYAHNEGVIHRDIKPGNIFILKNRQAKLVDFGIARAARRETLDNNDQPATLFNNNLLGTPNYMSPEQAQARPVTKLTDIYSLGAVLYELLTNQKPFQTSDMNSLINQIISKPIKAPHEINPGVPMALSRITMKAMSKQPEKRYQSAFEMASDLRRFVLAEKRLKKQERTKSRPAHKAKERNRVRSGKTSSYYGRLFWLSCIAIIIAALMAANAWRGRW